MSWERPGYDTRTVRVVQASMGVLNLVLAGMVVYLRFGAFQRMVEGMEARGTEVPDWLELGFTGLVLAMAVFLGVRGLGLLRNAFRSSTED